MERKPRILVVDDDVPILGLMTSVLTEFGFEPLTAQSGEEALAMATAKHPDLVLLDIHMPGMTGPEVIARFRADGASTIPILILSGHPMSSADVAAAGADDAVMKPFDLQVLIGRIRAHLARHMQVNQGQ